MKITGEEGYIPVSGVFEIHLFGPVDADPETFAKFEEACKQCGRMTKTLKLSLHFETGNHFVPQSSTYISAPSVEKAREVSAELLKVFEAANVPIIREKIEAIAHNKGVPETDEEAAKFPEHYFEYHLRLNTEVCYDVSTGLSKMFGHKIPLSCNLYPPYQCFLNARTYEMGSETSGRLVDYITMELEKRGIQVCKRISEFIVFDSYKNLDKGWLE